MDDPVSSRRRRPVRKALIIATVVGPLLTVINQWEAVVGDGNLVVWKALLTFVVPFCVSLVSSYEFR